MDAKKELVNQLKEVIEKNEELNDIIENLCDGVYITDGSGKTLRVNKTYERMSGLKKEDLVGKNMEELVKEGVFSQSASLQVLKLKAPATVMYTVNTGKRLLAKGVPVFDSFGKIKMIVNNVWDLTEIYSLENETIGPKASSLQQEVDFIFHSPAMDKVVELALKASKVTSNVLILGESGVGKDVIANLIHKASGVKGTFIKVNCAAIPETLLESELFGYEYGSFTGAKKDGKAGLFQMANNGTIFLDEIAELPTHLQAKLLRVIQDKEVIPIGATKSIAIESRVIAATNKNIETAIDTGLFREDLYYRLNVVSIKIPPLRNRVEDIQPLARYFMDLFNKKYSLNKRLSKGALEALERSQWRGNVRELENTIERLAVVVDGNVIAAEDIAIIQNKPLLADKGKGSLKEQLMELEVKLLRESIVVNKTTRRAAKALGIDQSTLVRKLQKYGMKMMD
ncbi:sigma-54 interaction domain-containing protein [Alkaliphilus serpentinus]|uniref:HTH-type transcriptional regulatory protein TyrR n=1 Tax=Alkaliphilus serpentinus TaxID=1482731 RepID=A0A833HP49_9FIRM|nr:sigma 54-interacting transcriptional regulator [Alkaliphilus serpentinus]KAB3530249.1 PAS domain S-box protein [Alkaliphilus serpentinus]